MISARRAHHGSTLSRGNLTKSVTKSHSGRKNLVAGNEWRTPCRTGKLNGHQGGGTGRHWRHKGSDPMLPPSFARLATSGLTPGSDGKEEALQRKGGGTATERGLRSLLCRIGDSCSGARHWVRPSVASSGTEGSDPLSHRQTERTAGGQNGAALGGGRGGHGG